MTCFSGFTYWMYGGPRDFLNPQEAG